jgi:hypothetical protein
MIDSTGGFLPARRRDLAGGDESNEQSDDEEGKAEVRLDLPAPAIETPEYLFDPGRGPERLRSLLRRPTEQQSKRADGAKPSKDGWANEPESEPDVAEEQGGVRLCV